MCTDYLQSCAQGRVLERQSRQNVDSETGEAMCFSIISSTSTPVPPYALIYISSEKVHKPRGASQMMIDDESA